MTFSDLKAEFRLVSDGDDWGTAMLFWFAIADEIHFNRDFPVPNEWEFRPSPLGPSNEEGDYIADTVREADDDSLARFGALIHRYARLLRHLGKDY